MKKIFGKKLWMRVMAVVLAVAINMGALDGIIRYTVRELALGGFSGFLKTAEANTPQAEKTKTGFRKRPDLRHPKTPGQKKPRRKMKLLKKGPKTPRRTKSDLMNTRPKFIRKISITWMKITGW